MGMRFFMVILDLGTFFKLTEHLYLGYQIWSQRLVKLCQSVNLFASTPFVNSVMGMRFQKWDNPICYIYNHILK